MNSRKTKMILKRVISHRRPQQRKSWLFPLESLCEFQGGSGHKRRRCHTSKTR